MANPATVISEAETEKERVQENLRIAAQWFHENRGELFKRNEAIIYFKDELDVTERVASRIISQLVGDMVDPVVLVNTEDESYVGIIEYHEHDIWYGYRDYDDLIGERNIVVCAQCVNEKMRDSEIYAAKSGEGSFSDGTHHTFDTLGEGVREHFEKSHDLKPDDVETGAVLISGTTIGGNIAWHAGNDGSGSGLDADELDGNDSSAFASSSVPTSIGDVDFEAGAVIDLQDNGQIQRFGSTYMQFFGSPNRIDFSGVEHRDVGGITLSSGSIDLSGGNIVDAGQVNADSITGVIPPLDVDEGLNMTGVTRSIQDGGTNAIIFSGTADITIPNGSLTVSGGNIDADGNQINGAARLQADSGTANLDLVFDGSVQGMRVRNSNLGITLLDFTATQVDVIGDFRDDVGNVIYDQSEDHIPQERVEQGPNSGLDADTVDGQEASALGGISDDDFIADASGTVLNTETGILYITSLPDSSSLEITQAALLLADGTAAPSNLDLIIGTLDNAGSGTSETNVIQGDGSTVFDDQTGSPLASYSNTSGNTETVFIGIDNGDFNPGTGSDQEIFAHASGSIS